ncbi:hypothetical protein AMECASPLE_026794, partial [Ameca splendens]
MGPEMFHSGTDSASFLSDTNRPRVAIGIPGKEEVQIHRLPCGACGKNWEDTWEPATSQYLAVPEVSPPSA